MGKGYLNPPHQSKGGTRRSLCWEPEDLAVTMDTSHSDRSEEGARDFCKKWVWATQRGEELCPVQCEMEKNLRVRKSDCNLTVPCSG